MSRLMSEGEHDDVTVSRSWLGESSKGNIQICVEFYDEGEESTITAYLATTDNAMKYTMKKLEAMDFDLAANDYKLGLLDQQENSPLTSWRGKIVVKNEPYNGRDSLKVDSIGDVTFQERMDAGKVSAWEQTMRRKLIAARGSQPSAPRTAAKPKKAAPPVDDDDPGF